MGKYFKTTVLNISRNQEPIVALTVRNAETPEEKRKGLRGETNIGDGMYFSFNSPRLLQFEMKGMKRPIDMLFMKHNVVQKILKNLQPGDAVPTASADAVLEVPAGLSDKYAIREGDLVKTAKIYEFNSYDAFKAHTSPEEYSQIRGELSAQNLKKGYPENRFPEAVHRVSITGKDNYVFLDKNKKHYKLLKKHELTHAIRNRKGTKGYELKYKASPIKAATGTFIEEMAAQRRMLKGTGTGLLEKIKDYTYPFEAAIGMFKKKRKILRAIK